MLVTRQHGAAIMFWGFRHPSFIRLINAVTRRNGMLLVVVCITKSSIGSTQYPLECNLLILSILLFVMLTSTKSTLLSPIIAFISSDEGLSEAPKHVGCSMLSCYEQTLRLKDSGLLDTWSGNLIGLLTHRF